MIFSYDVCPICGSNDIELISTKSVDGNTVNFYRCHSCDASFDTTKKLENYKEKLKHIDEDIKKKEEKKLDAVQVFNKNIGSVLAIVSEDTKNISRGTGIVIDKNLIITNAHVIINKTLGSVSYGYFYKSDKPHTLVLDKINEELDIAVLKSSDIDTKPVECSTNVLTGDHCFVLGNSKGLGIAIFDGIISDASRIVENHEHTMFSAPVTHGNSGGPLFNSDGKLIGMVKMGSTDFGAMNYAIPLKIIKNFLK